MTSKKPTIKDLMLSLKNPKKAEDPSLPNTVETWKRIAEKDPFLELGLEKNELSIFLTEWIEDNPYSDI